MTTNVPVVQPAVVTGKALTVGHPMNPVVTFASDPTLGTYISAISVGSLVARFAPCAMFRVTLWHVATATRKELYGTEEVAITQTFDSATGVTNVVVLLHDYPDIGFQMMLTPLAEGFRITQSFVNNDSAHGTEFWDFPRLGCVPDSGVVANAYLCHGHLTGSTFIHPHLEQVVSTSLATIPVWSPSGMQVTDYFDISTKLHVYVATDDDTGYLKEWLLEGDGSRVSVQSWRHHPVNPRRAGNGGATPITLTYNLDILIFRGLTADGRCGHYDTAIRYRRWATASARPSMIRGPWMDWADISDRVKNCDLYWVLAPPDSAVNLGYFNTFITDLVHVKTFVGADEMLCHLYHWGANQPATLLGPTFKMPQFTPIPVLQQTDVNNAMETAQDNDIHVTFYTVPLFWDPTLLFANGDPFAIDKFIGQIAWNDIRQYMAKYHDNSYQTLDGKYGFDCAQFPTQIKGIIKDCQQYDGTGGVGITNLGYYTNPVFPPHGFYLDVWTGIRVGLNYGTAQTPNGNIGTWAENRRTITTYLLNQMKALDVDFFFTSEAPEEGMIPAMDVQHDSYNVTRYGANNSLFSIVYSRYQCLLDLSIQLGGNVVVGDGQWQPVVVMVMARFHATGGHLCVNNSFFSLTIPTNPPTLFNCPYYPLLIAMKRTIDRLESNPAFRTYMRRGLRMRPLPASPEGDFIETSDAGYYNTAYSTPGHNILSSVWLNPATNVIGIIITALATQDLPFNIYMEAEAYDLAVDRGYTLFRNVDGVLTEITRFVGVLDVDVTLVFDGSGGAFDLLEIKLSV